MCICTAFVSMGLCTCVCVHVFICIYVYVAEVRRQLAGVISLHQGQTQDVRLCSKPLYVVSHLTNPVFCVY